ncbi:MAG: radical SAM protein [Nanoarchaeota archaeon]|nr:radical SAM protein [Nanoarchaeota archaeon]
MTKYFMDGSKLMYHLPKVTKWINGEKFYPIHAEISPSSGCNQRCILCCVDYKGHHLKNLSKEILLKLIDDFKEADVKSFLLAGEGEPLINKYCIEMLQKAKNVGIDAALNTNGVLFTPEVADNVLDTLSWMRFSIQAPDSKIYHSIHRTSEEDFNKTIENIKYAIKLKKEKNLKVKIGIQQILINENYNLVLESAKFAKELGVDYYTIKRFAKHPDNTYDVPEDLYKKSIPLFKEAEKLSDDNFAVIIRWNQFENQPRDYSRCRGLPFITQILADGSIYPCCQFFGKEKFKLGDLNKQTFKEIFDSENAQNTIKFIEKEYDINKNKCMTYCRHHSTNLFLNKINDFPEHVNFI